MRFLLDTNILIPLEDSSLLLKPSLANFVRLANQNGHSLVFHPASEDDIAEDKNAARREQTLQRLSQYTRLDARPPCPWNEGVESRNDRVDNEILYALSLHAAHGLITEDRGIHDKAKARRLVDRVYTIQTAEDLLRRLHETTSVHLPNVEEVPLFTLTPELSQPFFDSLRDGYPEFEKWFERKAEEGRRAWISRQDDGHIGALCVFARQVDERITESLTLPGPALKLSTFKVAETNRGRKIGELFLKAAFQYATQNCLHNIFLHGDRDKHHFLFEMLSDFGFEEVGSDPGSGGRDAVFVKRHPTDAPPVDRTAFEYLRSFFPHFVVNANVSKYVVPIRPQYHDVLFPGFSTPSLPQQQLFAQTNKAGNAIKMAYLCRAQTSHMEPGDLVLFYRSSDIKALTGVGVVESYETMSDADSIAARVKRRTVYSLREIEQLAERPTRVMLFRFVRHFEQPIPLAVLIRLGVLNGVPQSITNIKDASSRISFRSLRSVALVSIHPRFAEAIVCGEKNVEFRRRWARESVDALLIYATAPDRSLAALVQIDGVSLVGKEALWDKCRDLGGGLTRAELRNYFDGVEKGIALALGARHVFEGGLSPRVIFGNSFRPPQSFRYLSAAEIAKVQKVAE